MLQNSWSINLPQQPTHCTIASLPNPSMVFQARSNQLSVYTTNNNKTETLPIRKEILSLATINDELILMLTRYNLSCLDLLNNEEKFTIEFENAERMQVIGDRIYVVCGSSLYCYDLAGEEMYVNHVSANIAAIARVESEKGGLVIANVEMGMARYVGLNIEFEYSKIVGTATSMCWIGKGVFVGTKEGTVAFYESKKSKWKAKSSHAVMKVLKYRDGNPQQEEDDVDIKGEEVVFVLRENGTVELRDWTNGGTINKVKCGEEIREAFITDFRKQGYEQVLTVLSSGTIKAFNIITDSQKSKIDPSHKDIQKNNNNKNIIGQEAINNNLQLQTLSKMKASLTYEIKELKEILANKDADENEDEDEILNKEFRMKAVLEYEEGLNLIISCHEGGYISGLTFQEPIMPVLVEKTQELKYKFRNKNESAGEIVCQVLVHSSMNSSKHMVKTLNIFLPKFWKWGLDPKSKKNIEGRLKFKMIERNARYLKWMKQCFFMNLAQKDEEKMEASPILRVRFSNYYVKEEMELVFAQREGWVEIHCDCLKTMGDVVQDLVNYVGLKDLNTELSMPREKERIKDLLNTVERLSQAKVSISSDMAESINIIKFLLVKGESARQVGSMNSFRKTYGEVMEQNRSLVTEIDKKNLNTKTLSQAMKSVGNFINQIASVRYGESKNQVIARCRQAIKKKNFPVIIDIMEQGVEMSE